jgi:hypothetical protein
MDWPNIVRRFKRRSTTMSAPDLPRQAHTVPTCDEFWQLRPGLYYPGPEGCAGIHSPPGLCLEACGLPITLLSSQMCMYMPLPFYISSACEVCVGREIKVSTSISPFFCASESHASRCNVHCAPALLIRHQVDMKPILLVTDLVQLCNKSVTSTMDQRE